MQKDFTLTNRQQEALSLLGGPQRHTLLVGGARSGKTFLLVRSIYMRAARSPGSRHCILRFRYNAVRQSIWLDTLPKVRHLCFPTLNYKENRQDGYVEFKNGSQIWFGGLDDKERVEKILGQEYCIDPDSKVLTSDLRWVSAKTLQVGQELMAFPENLDGHRTLQRSTVERTNVIQAPRYRITTDKGVTVVSDNHKFVVHKDDRRHKHFRTFSWLPANELTIGDQIQFAAHPWETDNSKGGGWMAGILDGEGWCSGPAGNVGVAQNPGPVLDHIKQQLADREIPYTEHKDSKRPCRHIQISGTWGALRLLGSVRPIRLLPKAPEMWEGVRAFNKRSGSGDTHLATVLSIEPLGVGPVISLSTSSRTLIADGFLGHNCTIYLNECSQIPYSSVLVALTRLAQNCPELTNRVYYDLNPTGSGHWSHKLFIEKRNPQTGLSIPNPTEYQWMYLNPRDNEENLADGYIGMLESLPTRARRRFLEGQYTAEVDGALWTTEGIERCRHEGPLPDMRRVVIGVDPSGTAGKDDKRNDDIGIVVAGVDSDGIAYIMEDASCAEGPAGWGRKVVRAFMRNKADAVIAEANYGGEMVRHVIESAAKDACVSVPVHLVSASRGKAVRAEPVSALYEQGRVRHAESFLVLEDQLLNFSTNGWLGEKSPDRADAAIWAITHLLVRPTQTLEFCVPILATRSRLLVGDPARNPISGPTERI